jgi:ubiquinone/menaquinone biosynthesis C-methylase UbiE
MKLHRDFTNKINWILDNLIPPLLRDNKFFMSILFKLLYKDKTKYYLEFKEKMPFMSHEELSDYYRQVSDLDHNQRDTDLNTKCIEAIMKHLAGINILDIACGRGYLAKKIALDQSKNIFGIDIIPPNINEQPNLRFIKGNIENIPFDDKFFDTVICAHTLEHTTDINRALSELRRVTKKRLIIVLPRQREHKYTFDFHIHFFPYPHSLLKVLKPSGSNWKCDELDGDFFYYEDY